MSDRILIHLPDFYLDVQDFEEIGQTETIELDTLDGAMNQLFDDQFVMTASLRAIKIREQMLGIQADPTIETIDFRRLRILNRYQTKPPFTVRYLQQQLDMLVGAGMTIVSVDVQDFILTVTANIDDAAVFREVLHTVETIKPANLIYQQNTALGSKIKLEEHISKQQVNWHYRLDDTWRLGEQPFATLGPEVPIK
ncbi:DUF2313 domain-containing protein [Paenibacillaceae bacterium]|nr:DUF2313 domain-containing protein [Paenibacillaceae bacterium]